MKDMYNENIELIQPIHMRQKKEIKLKDNEFFVLMVTDENKYSRPKEDYWDFEREYIGLERTGKEIYISKKFNNRFNLLRGTTFLVKVKDKSKCYELTYD